MIKYAETKFSMDYKTSSNFYGSENQSMEVAALTDLFVSFHGIMI